MNNCGNCNACCYSFVVEEINKPACTLCPNYEGECTIYKDRPTECRTFDCAWLQSDAPDKFRPDNCGIIFEKLSDMIFFGTVIKDVTVDAKNQVSAFLNQGFSVVLSSKKEKNLLFLISPSHNEEFIKEQFRVIKNGHIRN